MKRKCCDGLVLDRCSHAEVNLESVWLACARGQSSSLLDLPIDLNGKISLLICVLGIPIGAVEGMRERTEKGAKEYS